MEGVLKQTRELSGDWDKIIDAEAENEKL
jgi:hypothetical protein